MKLVANIKLKPTKEQETLLRSTLERCNDACNWLSGQAWEAKIFRQYDLHKLCYHELRAKFEITAQVAVRCIAKVADSYKVDQNTQRTFRKHSAQPYDDRILRFCADDVVSIWLVSGREKIAHVCGDHQRELLKHRKGEVDLVFMPYDGTRPLRGRWFLACVIDGDPEMLIPSETDIAYFAGLFDGEGCISMTNNSSRIPRLTVMMAISHKPALVRLSSWFGGCIHEPKRFVNKPMFQWHIGQFSEVLYFLEAIFPFLDEKREQAELAIAYLKERIKHADRSRLPDDVTTLAIQTAEKITACKQPMFAHQLAPVAVESPRL